MFLKIFGKKSDGGKKYSVAVASMVSGIDPEMNYCPLCRDEYRRDSSHCGVCNVPLMTGKEKLEQAKLEAQVYAERSMELLPTDELINIRRGPIKEMKSLQQLLAKERIPAILAGDENGCAKGCCGPELYLQIKRADLDLASEVLTKEFIKSTALDDHDLSNAAAVFDEQAAETVCPACGCKFPTTIGACPECGLCFK